MSTTIFIPMPEWQAIAFLRDRAEAFHRLVTPFGNWHQSEVILEDGVLTTGLKQRDKAIEAGYETHPQGFAILRMSIGKLTHAQMTLYKQLSTGTHPDTGAPTWKVTAEGLTLICEKTPDDAEVLMDEIFGPKVPVRFAEGGTVPTLDGEGRMRWIPR